MTCYHCKIVGNLRKFNGLTLLGQGRHVNTYVCSFCQAYNYESMIYKGPIRCHNCAQLLGHQI